MKEKAQQILDQLAQGKYGWLGVKRFNPINHEPKDLYAELTKHHQEETGKLIQIIKELAEEVVKK